MAHRIIVIDPGHGGRDPGAIGPSGIFEKDINLAICKFLFEFLKNKFDLVLTRSSDRYVSLKRRVSITKNNRADLFISIHSNSALKEYMKGSEVHISTRKKFKTKHRKIGKLILKKLEQRLKFNNLGIKESKFTVLRNPICPKLLLEINFLSNPKMEKILSTSRNQRKIAKCIADALLGYYYINFYHISSYTQGHLKHTES